MVNIRDIHDLLNKTPFFQGVENEHLKTIAGCGKLVHFNAGEFLIREGETADMFYLIRKGEVAIECYIPGQGAMHVARIGAGDVTGFSWLFPPYRNSFDSHAISDVSAIALDGECLRGKAEYDHELGYHLMRLFAELMLERLQATRRQMLDVYANTSAQNS